MRAALAALLLVPLAACQSPSGQPAPADARASAASPMADADFETVSSVETEGGTVDVVDIAGGLEHPWGLTFLPDGRMLVTERSGALRIVGADGTVSAPVEGTPEVWASGQGGLLDVALAPDFGDTGLVYLSYARAGAGGTASTALGRGVLDGDALRDWQELFVQAPAVGGGRHFGSRIAFGPDGHLFLSTGDRGQGDPAQDLGSQIGKVLRLNPDGSVPDDNPFVGQEGDDAVWSYGHRNAQGLAFRPGTDELWETEFGPKGGDELNRVERGVDYGWPAVSWGTEYNGTPIPDPPTAPQFRDAVAQWSPVISPSGIAFYTGDAFPAWQGDLLIASLSASGLVRVSLDGDTVTSEETIELGARIREVEVGPDGFVYVLTDLPDGHVWRLEPADG